MIFDPPLRLRASLDRRSRLPTLLCVALSVLLQACVWDVSAPFAEPDTWAADDVLNFTAASCEEDGEITPGEICEIPGITVEVCGTGAEKDDDGNCVCEVSWQEMNKDGNCVDNDDDGGDGGDAGGGDDGGGDDGGGGGNDDDDEDPNCTEDQEAIAEEYDDAVNWPCTKFVHQTKGEHRDGADGLHGHETVYLNPKYDSGSDNVLATVASLGVSGAWINSDWRCPIGNKAVGSGPGSQHRLGTAGDFDAPGFDKDIYDDFYKAAKAAGATGISGFGPNRDDFEYETYIHIDWR